MREDGHLPVTKADLRGFATKADFAELKSDVADIRELLRPIATIAMTVAHHSVELADIRRHIKEKLVTREEFYSTMDGYARRVENFDYSSAKDLTRLDDHEKRIDALEKRA